MQRKLPGSAWLSFTLFLAWTCLAASTPVELEITIPEEYEVTEPDAYVCTSVPLPEQPHKLVGVMPLAKQEVVHHILLYGCQSPHIMPEPGKPPPVWNCMTHGVCNDGSSDIIYGWGRNAPELKLPDGVGFSVGEGTTIRYIVAQVHFLEKRPKGDHSGVRLRLAQHSTPFAAGLIAFASGFSIPPGKSSHLVENECCYQGHQPLTTFAMRVHTHTLGKNVFMTRETWNHTGLETIGQRNPQLPQAFVPVNRTVIWPGDRLKVTCDFDSTSRAQYTNAGSTHNDEMCNMYMMVYGPQPFITMCSDSSFYVSDASPGAMERPQRSFFALDPSPFWKPPEPENSSGPTHLALGDITSITLAGDSSLWALYRGSRHWVGDTFDDKYRMTDKTYIPEAVVARLDPDTGAVLSTFGSDTFAMPHMITIDREDNVWVVDVGRHQVLKFNSHGKLLFAVGEELKPGSGQSHFCQPTQVFVLRDGSFWVSDGYCNSRLVNFDANGKFVNDIQMPRKHTVVHSVLVDECQGVVYAASREDGMVHAFHVKSGEMQRSYDLTQWGRVWALRMGPFGLVLALTWEEGKDTTLVDLNFPDMGWVIPGVAAHGFAHDFVLGPAPAALSGAGDRLMALYLARTCGPPGCGPLLRFVQLKHGQHLPDASIITLAGPKPLPGTPGVSYSAVSKDSAGGADSQSGVSAHSMPTANDASTDDGHIMPSGVNEGGNNEDTTYKDDDDDEADYEAVAEEEEAQEEAGAAAAETLANTTSIDPADVSEEFGIIVADQAKLDDAEQHRSFVNVLIYLGAGLVMATGVALASWTFVRKYVAPRPWQPLPSHDAPARRNGEGKVLSIAEMLARSDDLEDPAPCKGASSANGRHKGVSSSPGETSALLPGSSRK